MPLMVSPQHTRQLNHYPATTTTTTTTTTPCYPRNHHDRHVHRDRRNHNYYSDDCDATRQTATHDNTYHHMSHYRHGNGHQQHHQYGYYDYCADHGVRLAPTTTCYVWLAADPLMSYAHC